MSIEHVDVLIIGAGLSGIGAGVHLQKESPERSFAILEARDAIGGTWDLFRYPGIRSDSDMYTLGYVFKPWTNAKAIADGASIREYIEETAQEHGLSQHIRLGHRVKRATWSSQDSRWTIEIEKGPNREPLTMTCLFYFACSGYYKYEQGYTPDFPGKERFKGRIVHPQHWRSDLDYTNQRVVVIGSGATAVTLVPSMADKAAHVTMLQRSPTYVMTLPGKDKLATALRRVLPESLAYGITRWKNVGLGMFFFGMSKRYPDKVKKAITTGVQRALGPDYDVAKHFTPSYKPWDQRVCIVPDGDLFRAIKKGRASVVTDHIETFTEDGIRLRSGQELKADLIVTATGLDLVALGGVEIVIDGKPLVMREAMSYKGMMLSNVPNLAYVIGYTNASWTLKGDLTCQYVCRLLNHMRQHHYQQCVPTLNDPTVKEEAWIDFSSGYIQRSLDQFPKQGNKKPWRLHQNYARDIMTLRHGEITDNTMTFR